VGHTRAVGASISGPRAGNGCPVVQAGGPSKELEGGKYMELASINTSRPEARTAACKMNSNWHNN
jgi:hypothetical protein